MNKVQWSEFRHGWMGLLPCGITIVILHNDTGGWTPRFGTATSKHVYSSPDAAKAEGVAMARRIMTECLVCLAD